MLVTLFALQAAITPVDTRAEPPRCGSDAGPDVLVCGSTRPQESYRLRPLASWPGSDNVDRRLHAKLPGGADLAPDTDQGRLGEPQGKVRLTIPF